MAVGKCTASKAFRVFFNCLVDVCAVSAVVGAFYLLVEFFLFIQDSQLY